MTRILHGIVRGRSIDIEEELGLQDGESVEVKVTRITLPSSGQGLARCAGVLAADWSAEDDRILKELHQQRKLVSQRELPT